MYSFLGFLWFLRTTRAILFWLYLWQLKEYHLGRFLDHFRTYKGQRIFLNGVFLFKLALIFIFFIYPIFIFFILTFIYIAESLKILFDSIKRKIKKPILTKKTFFLILTCLLFEFLSIFILINRAQDIVSFIFWLLVLDVLIPIITSAIVLIFQPLAVLGRNQIIKKAKEKRKRFKNLIVIGVTGSYGKTSTKEFLSTILSEKFKVLKTKEHQNSEVGISFCILNELTEEHEIFICEMGAYNKGGIKLLCDIAKPKIGIITGVNEQHLATFKTMENLLSAEGGRELIESLPEDGIAFFNGKNKYCRDLYQETKIEKYLYGENTSLFLENLEGAKLVAQKLGMTDKEISRGVEKIKNILPGIEIKKGINRLTIIDATYSSNPTGVIAHLEYLKTFKGKKIIVMPCLIELGKASKEVHQRIGEKIVEVCDLAIITTKECFECIRKKAGDKALFIETPKKIFEKIKSFTKEEDIVLLESRVPTQLITLLEINA